MSLFYRYNYHNHSTLPQELPSSLSSNTQQLVMVVDDEADIAKIMGKALRLKGLNVETFTDPVKALEVFKKKNNQYHYNNDEDENNNNCKFNDNNDYNCNNNKRQRQLYYSLVLSDIRMPHMNGYELVKEIKIIDPKVKVILMSAFEANEYDVEHNMTTIPSVDALITKPAPIAKVQEIVLDTITKRSTTIKMLLSRCYNY